MAQRAGREVQDAVDAVQHGVHVVSDEDDGRPALSTLRVEQIDDAALVGEVERQQRLVGEDQHRVGDERLRDAQPLLLAAGEPADRRVRVGGCADLVQRRVDSRAVVCVEAAEAPAVAVEAEPHEVAPAQRRRRGRRSAAAAHSRAGRQRSRGGQPSITTLPGARLEQPEQDPKQRRLAGSVRPEDCEQLAVLELEARALRRACARRSGA